MDIKYTDKEINQLNEMNVDGWAKGLIKQGNKRKGVKKEIPINEDDIKEISEKI